MLGLSKEEITLFKSLNTPQKVQDFINRIPINFEEKGDTCYSPKKVLKENKCHCIEGAILAALILRTNGHPPLIVDLEASEKDFDHVIAVFKIDNKWGAISKTNHAVLRYRDPVYKSVRELVMSYFNEYSNEVGEKTLRKFSNPVNLSKFDGHGWMHNEEDVWYIPNHLTEIKHFPIIERKQIFILKELDEIERKANKITEWQSDKAKKNL